MHGCRRLCAVAAVVTALAAVLPATTSAAEWPRRLFPIARAADPQVDAVQDFLERPGGAILIASGSDGSYVKRLAESFEEERFPERCRRFTARRVDCVPVLAGEAVIACTLRRTGVIWRRPYACADPQDPFRRTPNVHS